VSSAANAAHPQGSPFETSRRTEAIAWMLLALLGIIWGTNFIFMKIALKAVPPLEVAWLRTLFGVAPVLLLGFARGVFSPRDWRFAHHFAVMALLANVGPYVTFVYGTANLPSGIAGVVSGAIPFVTAGIVAATLPAERLTRSKLLGLLVGFAGILLVAPIRQTGAASHGSPLLGVAMMLTGCVSYALALVYARRFIAPLNLSSIKLAGYQMALAALLLSPFAAPGHWAALANHIPSLLALILGLGLVGTGVAFVIYYRLIHTLGAMKAASVYYLPPVVALIVGSIFAGEPVTALQAVGAALVLAGIFYANRR
jgi:drug/metabolite transporter (DMT)-like permease